MFTIKCFVYNKYDHYAFFHNSSKFIMINVVISEIFSITNKNVKNYYFHIIVYLLLIINELISVLIIQKQIKSNKQIRILQKSIEIRKLDRQTNIQKIFRVDIQYMADKENEQNQKKIKNINKNTKNEKIEKLILFSIFFIFNQAIDKQFILSINNYQNSNQQFFQIRIIKTRKV